ncbi:MAG TPA: TIGR00266 family protein [Leptospiraceae bacterium]|nr:TIGR00266 family protein [Leptospiraceae bacterium]HMY69294.1 TIGR00266 family protein [Leptospiraceae bacterium]HNF16413.1 TIGR00266 family protein [Leptospiraceae bacterium]HNF27124.1 TIGR00266 family protein [Leptospiraceae bacterium]HNH09824.1 TIGR00266 family protein [Leptospiraceae bacterium]
MKTEINGAPAFAYVHVDLEPGESFIAESDAMSSMSTELELRPKFNGGFFKGLLRKFLGGESLFINEFSNPSSSTQRLTIVQPTPGDIREIELKDNTICMQPGAYIASTPGVKIGLQWAGFASFIAREGLFKITASGTGKLLYGCYGGLVEKEVKGEYIVDSGHLVAYEPQLQLKLKLAGGLISSFTSGEGIVTKIIGNGKIYLQSRSLEGLASWINPHLY